MKKICIVNFNVYCLFNPESSAPMGGAELDMYTVAKGLESAYDVTVITGDWGQKEDEIFGKIHVFRSFELGKKGMLRFFRGVFLFWNNLSQVDADVYISSGAGPEIGIIAFFCKLKKKKFIYRTASEIDCNKKYINLNGIKGLIYKYGLENSHRIVTTVRQHKNLLACSHSNTENKVLHINLGIFSGNKQEQGKDSVLWVGRCDSLKNPDAYIDIAKYISDYKFVMICPRQKHNSDYFEEIKRKAESLPNMTFIDFVPFKDIQPYFDKSKIFVNTSDFEGFTYTLIQSGLARTPVVYLNVNPDEVITKHNIGYVADGDKEKMAEQISMLLNDEKDWKEKSENAFRYVKENHDINIVGEQWKNLLEEI
ncbi:MAG: glycosyltransferase family 4 protein [Candidatus Moranbacteria bacterium]|nr:glycosyltransferase family 4 protein [Candidatus Moranbacteria bacterium]MDD3964945.1 glycosyltransferase family 4 protein [Candidatus Moranbacteria bacterium]